jgi:WD40 repeat protein
MEALTMTKKHFSIFLVAVFLVITGCASAFKNEEQKEADRVALELSRVHAFGASGAAFTPDGSKLAIGSREKIWVVNTDSLDVTAHIPYQRNSRFGGKKSLEFIDNHRLVIAAEGAILLWDLQRGRVTDRVNLKSKAFSPRAITWSSAGHLLAFSTGTSREPVSVVPIGDKGFGAVRTVAGFEGVPGDLVFSRDGRYLAASGDGEGVAIREVETGQDAGALPTKGYVNTLELFDENRLLVAGSDIAFWTFLDERQSNEFDNPDLQGQVNGQVAVRVAGVIALGTLAYFAIPIAIFTGDVSAVASFIQAGTDIANIPVKTERAEWCGRSTAISPDGRWLADIYPGITKEVIRVYDLKSDAASIHLNPKGEYSCAVKFNPNGKILLITTEKTARLYDTETWRHRDLKLDKSR